MADNPAAKSEPTTQGDFAAIVDIALSDDPTAATARRKVYEDSGDPDTWRARFLVFDIVTQGDNNIEQAIKAVQGVADPERIELLLVLVSAKTPGGWPRRRIVRQAITLLEKVELHTPQDIALLLASQAATLADELIDEPILAARLLACATRWCRDDPAHWLLALQTAQTFSQTARDSDTESWARIAAGAPGSTAARAKVILLSLYLRTNEATSAGIVLENWNTDDPANKLAKAWMSVQFAEAVDDAEKWITALTQSVAILGTDPTAATAIGLDPQAVITKTFLVDTKEMGKLVADTARVLAASGQGGFAVVEALVSAGDVVTLRSLNLPAYIAQPVLARATVKADPTATDKAIAMLDEVVVDDAITTQQLLGFAQAASEIGHPKATSWATLALRQCLDTDPTTVPVASLVLAACPLDRDAFVTLSQAAVFVAQDDINESLPLLVALTSAPQSASESHWQQLVDLLWQLAQREPPLEPLMAFLGATLSAPFNSDVAEKLCALALKDETFKPQVEHLQKSMAARRMLDDL